MKMTFYRSIVCFLLVLSAIMSAAVIYPNAVSVPSPTISAQSAVLIDADTGKTLYEKDASLKLPMASTTKIMTAIVALENSNLSDKVAVSSKAVGIEGSSIYLHEDELLTMENLICALLLASANDAATAIAIEVAGSISLFADMMNDKAKELGLCNTHFVNPHGLDDEEHYTTASDLAKIAAYGLQNKDFARIVSTYKTTIPLDGSGSRVLINHNKMLRFYEGAIGVKTGFTKRSGRCLVSAAGRDGLRLVAVTLNAPNDWSDHRKMLDYGFSAYNRIKACGAGEYQIVVPVVGGKESTVLCANSSEIAVTLTSDKAETGCVFKVESPRFLYAPFEEGEVIGKLICISGGEIIGETELTTVYGVEKVTYKRSIWEKIADFFANLFS